MSIARIAGRYYSFLFKFYFPNLRKILDGTLRFGRGNRFNQLTRITGRGSVEIGNGCTFGFREGGHFRYGCIEIQPRTEGARIFIKDAVSFNNNAFLCGANYIEIGNRVLIGEHVSFFDHEAHSTGITDRKKPGMKGSIIIKDNVWIGNNVSVLRDSEIGENSIVALGAVVTGKFPDNVIIGGVPAKQIKDIK